MSFSLPPSPQNTTASPPGGPRKLAPPGAASAKTAPAAEPFEELLADNDDVRKPRSESAEPDPAAAADVSAPPPAPAPGVVYPIRCDALFFQMNGFAPAPPAAAVEDEGQTSPVEETACGEDAGAAGAAPNGEAVATLPEPAAPLSGFVRGDRQNRPARRDGAEGGDRPAFQPEDAAHPAELGVNVPPRAQPSPANPALPPTKETPAPSPAPLRAEPGARPAAAPDLGAAPVASENLAATLPEAPAAGIARVAVPLKNKQQASEKQVVAKTSALVGTAVAEEPFRMLPDSHLSAHASHFFEPASVVAGRVGGEAVPGALGAMHQAGAQTTTAADPRQDVALPVTAASAVQEIARLAERLIAAERAAIEVKFDFAGDTRLSLHVAVRDGALHTTFRTDSAELREALRQAWEAQPPQGPVSSLHFASPEFTAAKASAPGGASFDLSGGRSDQQSSAREESARSASAAAGTGFSRPGAGSSAASPLHASPSLRPDTALHLHTFA